ncbi:MAG: alpha/beta hydrolase [Bryobacteraceae bacterium]|nr:alpha/beta hydrolase [Bryobacteraceae bacterium]
MYLSRCGTGARAFVGIHGWSGTHRTYDPVLPAVPPSVSFYSVDLPGCGQSPPPAQWTVEAIATAVLTRLDEAGIVDFTLVGNCSGGLLGLEVARLAGSRVQRVILIDPFAYWPWYFKLFLIPVLGRLFYTTAFANPLGRLVTNLSLKAKRTQASNLTESFDELDHAVTHRYLHVLAQIKNPKRFRTVSAPVDIVFGEKTFAAVRESLPVWKPVFATVRNWELSGAGHLPIVEATSQFCKILFQEALCTSDSQPSSSSSAR